MATRTDILKVKFEVDGDGKVKVSLAGIGKAADDTGRKLDGMEKRATAAGKALGLALAAGATAAAVAITAAINNADRLNDMSERLGVSASKLSAWGYAAKQSGTDIEQLNTGLRLFSRNVTEALDADSRSGKLFTALGVDVKDATGNLRQLEDLVPDVATAFKNLNDPVLENALAMELFGKSGGELLQFLNEGADGLQTLEDRARSLGVVISDETAAKAAFFNDRLDDLKAAGQGLATQIAAELLPVLEELVVELTEVASSGDTAASIGDAIGAGFDIVAGAATVLSATVRGVTSDLIALGNAGQAAWSILTGNFAGAAGNLKQAAVAREMAAEQSARVAAVFSGEDSPRRVVQGNRTTNSTVVTRGTGQFANVNMSGDVARAAQLETRLKALMADRSGGGDKNKGGSSDADRAAAEAIRERAKAVRELQQELERITRAQEEFKEQTEDLAAELAGPLAQAELEHNRRLQEFRDLAKSGEVAATDLARAEQLLGEQYGKETDEIRKRLDPAAELIQQMQEELRLRTLNNVEARTAIDLAGLAVPATAAQAAEILALNKAMEAQGKTIEIMDELRSGIADVGMTAIYNFGEVDESFRDMMDNLLKQVSRRILEGWIESFLGSMGSTGEGTAGGGFFSSLLGALFGGGGASKKPAANSNTSGDWAGWVGAMFGAGAGGGGSTGGASSGAGGGFWTSLLGAFFGGGRDAGGDVQANRLYRVNERRPELLEVGGDAFLMMGGRGGRVVPDAMAGGSTVINQSFTQVVQGRMTRQTAEQSARANGIEARRAMARTGG